MCDCIKEYKDKSERYTHAIREGFYDKEQLKQEYYLAIINNAQYRISSDYF